MDGIICVDKPRDFTSFDVVAKLRGIAKTRKIGHSGTLDPMATGVLPLFLGAATKAVDLLPRHDKRYTATFQLGKVSDTQDITGTILREYPVTADRQQVEEALVQFRGDIMQVPPMYSAVKVNGKRLYDLARQGETVDRPARPVTIHSLTILECNEERREYTVDVRCSKGTYIRTLCHDVGKQLGCGAVLTALRRTEACGFSLEQCATLEQVQGWADGGALALRLLPVETAFSTQPRLELTDRQTWQLCNGIRIPAECLSMPDGCGEGEKSLAVFTSGNTFLGIAYVSAQTGCLHSRRIFYRMEREAAQQAKE